MTDFYFLAWLQVTISLFNTILLLWLGLTVLINAERRSLGVWLAGSGMILGGAFFMAHAAMLFYDLSSLVLHVVTWWYGGWIALIALPLAWFGLMLWYGGFWDDDHSVLHRRQKPWLAVILLTALCMTALIAITDPRYLLRHMALVALSSSVSDNRVLSLVIIYPVYLIACIVASLDALSRPAASARLMGDIARRRARPWLLATTLLQLVVSLLVGAGLMWIVMRFLRQDLEEFMGGYGGMMWSFDWWDTAICALIGAAVVLMGKAVVSYEIFTGKSLPRRGFLRQWRYIVLVAAVYSAVVATTLEFEWHPIYPLLMTTACMSILFALWSRNSYIEREHNMESLRPFMANQKLYQSLVESPSSVSSEHLVDATTPFYALCGDVLNASSAHLIPLGSMAPLVGAAVSFPVGSRPPLEEIGELKARLQSPQTMCVQLDSVQWNSMQWAVPLWSERGLIGVLLLGEKRDGGLYAQEEIEIARSSGERLLDMQAGAAMAQRLMTLQQQRLTQSHIMDGRARRILHDDILPQIHAAMLLLSTHKSTSHNGATESEAVNALATVHRQISDLLREMPTATAPGISRLGLLGALRYALDEEFKNVFDSINWNVDENLAAQTQRIAPLVSEVTFYAAREVLRNAARHARGGKTTQSLHIQISAQRTSDQEFQLIIEDNGVGMARKEESETAMSNNGGSGQGLVLHSTMMAVIGGGLSTENISPHGTRVVLSMPLQSSNIITR